VPYHESEEGEQVAHRGTEIVRVATTVAAVTDEAQTALNRTVSEAARARIHDGVPANTRRAYERQWASFTAWCAARGRQVLPATGETLAEYVSGLCDAGKAPATIEQAIATVRTTHRLAGIEPQPRTEPARLVLRSYKRQRAAAGQRNQRKALPVTIDTLRAMVDACDPTTPAGARDRLVLVLGLALMGRRSELAALTVDDVGETNDGLEVLVRTSKTDKDSVGEEIAIPRGAHPLTDPVRVFQAWLAVLDECGHTRGPLLRRVNRHGHLGASLSEDAINTIVRRTAVRAGVPDAERYTAHSLRAGGATVAYAAGVPVSIIARHGRWAEGSPVVLGYIRAVDRWKDNAMRNVGL
jgi:integrase